uniref:Two-component osmosensing histidine-kinase n=1 Tax=Ganoderma boninense TaxID=34458 RepID=A0A5K1JS46_9APHY|nr:Two-component osmosensing histidine-kinase [Ganoderma boninense]
MRASFDFFTFRNTAASLRERLERPSQSSSSTPRPASAHPSSPRRLHALTIPSPDNIVSESSPSHLEADEDNFSRRLKIFPHSPRAAHAPPAANGSPGKLYNPNTFLFTAPLQLPSCPTPHRLHTPHARCPFESFSPRRSQEALGTPVKNSSILGKHDPVLLSIQNRNHVLTAAVVSSSTAGRPAPPPESSLDWVSASSTSSVFSPNPHALFGYRLLFHFLRSL